MSEARPAGGASLRPSELRRKGEILETASQLFASRGMRISLEEIAGACGIKPGSLYHHFDSKEAIVVELIERYHAELVELGARATAQLAEVDPTGVEAQILGFATAIAECATRHSAAVQFTFYEPPGGASQELVQLAGRAPTAIQAAMLKTLELGQSGGVIRSDLALAVVSDRFCQTMLHVGLGLFHSFPPDEVAGTLCEILLHGLAVAYPKDSQLDRSKALAAVKSVIKTWPKPDAPTPTDRASMIYAAAKKELGRRGYEVTTIRDIAAAVGLGTGSVYRIIGSKEQLLSSIMRDFAETAVDGWAAALGTESTAVEKLDAVAWLQINVIRRFYDEFKIQLAWMRQTPPDIPTLGWELPALVKQVRAELTQGVAAGQLQLNNPNSDLAARCVIGMTWIPENIISELGERAAFIHARDTVLRGIAKR